MLFNELAKEWLYLFHHADIKPRTLLRYESYLKHHLYPCFKDMEIDNLKPRDIQLMVNTLKNRNSVRQDQLLSNSSINGMIAMIKMMFSYAYDFELISSNPTIKIKNLPKKESNDNKAFTINEQIKIEKYIKDNNRIDLFPIILTLYTGVRIGELCALSWNDINLKTGIMVINKTSYWLPSKDDKWKYVIDKPKTVNAYREIPLTPFLIEDLKMIKKDSKSSNSSGKRITDKTLVARYHSLLKKCHVRYLSFHSLRHTFATRALENGVDIKTLSEILGHSSVVTTLNIYAHSLMRHKKQQIRKIKRLIS